MKRIINRKRTNAFTLVELVAVMGCLSIIMGVAVTLLYQMFDLQIRSKEISEWTRSTNRFVDVFRDDVHRFGKPVIVSEDDILLRWQLQDSVIEYKLGIEEHVGQIVQRIEMAGEKIQNREEYRLSTEAELRFVEGTEKHEGLIALSLWNKPNKQSLPQVKIEEMNPFDRTWTPSVGTQEVFPPGVWRTVLVRYHHIVQGEQP